MTKKATKKKVTKKVTKDIEKTKKKVTQKTIKQPNGEPLVFLDDVCQRCFGKLHICTNKETNAWAKCICVNEIRIQQIKKKFNKTKPASKDLLKNYIKSNVIFFMDNDKFIGYYLKFITERIKNFKLEPRHEYVCAYEIADIAYSDSHEKFKSLNDLYKFDVLIIDLGMTARNKTIINALEQVVRSRNSRNKITWFFSKKGKKDIHGMFPPADGSSIDLILSDFNFEEYHES